MGVKSRDLEIFLEFFRTPLFGQWPKIEFQMTKITNTPKASTPTVFKATAPNFTGFHHICMWTELHGGFLNFNFLQKNFYFQKNRFNWLRKTTNFEIYQLKKNVKKINSKIPSVTLFPYLCGRFCKKPFVKILKTVGAETFCVTQELGKNGFE